MKAKVIGLFLAAFVAAASTALTGLTSVEVVPSTDRGYIRVTTNESIPRTGAVCGSIDVISALFVCQIQGWIATTGFGTASELSITPDVLTVVGSNLTCFGGATTSCSLVPAALGFTCLPGDFSAVSCNFTGGQIAGIVIGALILCFLVAILPFIICCVCCCCCGICAAAAG